MGNERPLDKTDECCIKRGLVPESHVTGQHSGRCDDRLYVTDSFSNAVRSFQRHLFLCLSAAAFSPF